MNEIQEMTKTILKDVSLWPLECLPVKKKKGGAYEEYELGFMIREEPLTIQLGIRFVPYTQTTKLVHTSLDNLIEDGWEVD